MPFPPFPDFDQLRYRVDEIEHRPGEPDPVFRHVLTHEVPHPGMPDAEVDGVLQILKAGEPRMPWMLSSIDMRLDGWDSEFIAVSATRTCTDEELSPDDRMTLRYDLAMMCLALDLAHPYMGGTSRDPKLIASSIRRIVAANGYWHDHGWALNSVRREMEATAGRDQEVRDVQGSILEGVMTLVVQLTHAAPWTRFAAQHAANPWGWCWVIEFGAADSTMRLEIAPDGWISMPVAYFGPLRTTDLDVRTCYQLTERLLRDAVDQGHEVHVDRIPSVSQRHPSLDDLEGRALAFEYLCETLIQAPWMSFQMVIPPHAEANIGDEFPNVIRLKFPSSTQAAQPLERFYLECDLVWTVDLDNPSAEKLGRIIEATDFVEDQFREFEREQAT